MRRWSAPISGVSESRRRGQPCDRRWQACVRLPALPQTEAPCEPLFGMCSS